MSVDKQLDATKSSTGVSSVNRESTKGPSTKLKLNKRGHPWSRKHNPADHRCEGQAWMHACPWEKKKLYNDGTMLVFSSSINIHEIAQQGNSQESTVEDVCSMPGQMTGRWMTQASQPTWRSPPNEQKQSCNQTNINYSFYNIGTKQIHWNKVAYFRILFSFQRMTLI